MVLIFQSVIFSFLGTLPDAYNKNNTISYWGNFQMYVKVRVIWQTTTALSPSPTMISSLAQVLTSQMFIHLTIKSPDVVWNQAGPWWKWESGQRVL